MNFEILNILNSMISVIFSVSDHILFLLRLPIRCILFSIAEHCCLMFSTQVTRSRGRFLHQFSPSCLSSAQDLTPCCIYSNEYSYQNMEQFL